MDYQGLITLEAGKRGGKPCIRGLRMTVSDVLDYLASGMSEDEILGDFPDLTRHDIRACLAFVAGRQRLHATEPTVMSHDRLPNAAAACVDTRKLGEYLLNPAHPDNGGKAAFFVSRGLARSDVEHRVST